MKDQALVSWDKRGMAVWYKDMEMKMKLYVMMLSAMIMTLTFFMLVVAFTQKTRDLTWEHGVLRSMGMTKAQGFTIFAHEATCIVTTSVVVGICIGISCTLLITNLQAQIMEMPNDMHFPYFNCSMLVLLITLSTAYAVREPVSQVNKKSISSIMKGLA